MCHLWLQLVEFLTDCVLCGHRWIGDAKSVQRMLGGLPCDGEYSVDDGNVVGHLAELLHRDAIHQFVGGLDGLFGQRLVLSNAIVERQSIVLLLVQQVHVANQLLTLLEQILRSPLILFRLFDARQIECRSQLFEQMALGHLVRVHLQAERVESYLPQSLLHHLQGSHLLGYEEHTASVIERIGYHVGDGLALSSSRRTIKNETASFARLHNGFHLRRVDVNGNCKCTGFHVQVDFAGISGFVIASIAYPMLLQQTFDDG